MEHFRQAVQGLRTENEIDVWGAFDERLAFLRGHAAGNADDQIAVVLAQFSETPQIGKDFFLCLFAYRTGIEQNQVGFFGIVGAGVVFLGLQQIGHFAGVVLVHLAAESLDEYFFGHGGASRRRRMDCLIV